MLDVELRVSGRQWLIVPPKALQPFTGFLRLPPGWARTAGGEIKPATISSFLDLLTMDSYWAQVPPPPKYMYAQIPAFHYQTFDRQSLKFSNVPIIPPNSKPPTADEVTDSTTKGDEAAGPADHEHKEPSPASNSEGRHEEDAPGTLVPSSEDSLYCQLQNFLKGIADSSENKVPNQIKRVLRILWLDMNQTSRPKNV